MTVLIKYPQQNKITNADFFKRKDNEDINWSYWGGWFDTDGTFTGKHGKLALKDHEPVRLFSKIFETSLRFDEYKTITPNAAQYIAKVFSAALRQEKLNWFCRNIEKFILSKKESLFKVCDQPFLSNQAPWTKQETINYIAGVAEGDGSFQFKSKNKFTFLNLLIASSNAQYLSDLQDRLSQHNLCNLGDIQEWEIYQTKKGERVKYYFCIYVSDKNMKNVEFMKSIYKVMTIERKKEKIRQFLNVVEPSFLNPLS
jgi:hypothetical protein